MAYQLNRHFLQLEWEFIEFSESDEILEGTFRSIYRSPPLPRVLFKLTYEPGC